MKKFLTLFLIAFTSVFILSFNNFIKIKPFNTSDVVDNIAMLSSNTYKGRLAGTKENLETAEYIRKELIKNSISPFCDNYFDSFNTVCPVQIQGSPYLKVYDLLGNEVKSFTYGKDYKEDMLNFKSNNVRFNFKDEIATKDNILQVKKGDDYYLFFVPDNDGLDFRSSFISTSIHSMYIMVTKETLGQITDYIHKGFSISCFIPYTSKEMPLNNVCGVINGSSKTEPPIILSAHYDHMGTDFAGNVYSGALDNASGVSFILEMSKFIKSLGTPKRTIIFTLFDAEEFGCKGSEAFVTKYKYYLNGSKVFNFDMIGSNNSVPLTIMGGKKDSKSTEFFRNVTSDCSANSIRYSTTFENSSDHEFFRENGIDAITFCDDDTTRIHTPKDKVQYISQSSIERCKNITTKEVIKYAFNDDPLLKYSNIFIIVCGPLSILISCIYITTGRE